MNAAIYARRSTEQRVAPELKSVTRQVENATVYAQARGWTVVATFVDDAVSGREFKRRPGLQAMLVAAERHEFEALVVAEQKALGREQAEVPYIIKRLALEGVLVHGYMAGRQITPTTPQEKLLLSVQGFSDEDHAVKTSERMHEAQLRRVKAGGAVGGALFGYRTIHLTSGEDAKGVPISAGSKREVYEPEAAVVRRVFEMYAAGQGGRAISSALDRLGIKPPQAAHWSPGTISLMLKNEAFHGVVVWNRLSTSGVWGPRSSRRPEAEVIRVKDETLRIVPEPLWRTVQARRAEVAGSALRGASGRLSGRPRKDGSVSLLAGLARCAVCGSGISLEGEKYRCALRRHGCASSCVNEMRLDRQATDEQVLRAVEEFVLRPERVEAWLVHVEEQRADDRRPGLERELLDVHRRAARLVAAVEAGNAPAAITSRLRELEARAAALEAALAASQPIPRPAPAKVRSRLAEWRTWLRGSPAQARSVLQRVVAGRITFTPLASGRGATFDAPARFAGLWSGLEMSGAVLAPDSGPVPDYVLALAGDDRGHPEDGGLERMYEQNLRRAGKGVRTAVGPAAAAASARRR